MMFVMKKIFFLSLLLSNLLLSYDRITGLPFASRSEVIAENGMAATSHPLATQAAIDILKDGGNAIDAAIAANAVLGLVEPTGCGIGGDLFAIIWDSKTNQLYGLNASGPAPKDMSIEFVKNLTSLIIPFDLIFSGSVCIQEIEGSAAIKSSLSRFLNLLIVFLHAS